MKKLLLLVPLVFAAPVLASEVTVGQVCKAVSAAMFGRDLKIMRLDKVESGIAYVHYIRQNDGTRWAIKCKLIGNQVMWALTILTAPVAGGMILQTARSDMLLRVKKSLLLRPTATVPAAPILIR